MLILATFIEVGEPIWSLLDWEIWIALPFLFPSKAIQLLEDSNSRLLFGRLASAFLNRDLFLLLEFWCGWFSTFIVYYWFWLLFHFWLFLFDFLRLLLFRLFFSQSLYVLEGFFCFFNEGLALDGEVIVEGKRNRLCKIIHCDILLCTHGLDVLKFLLDFL